jgi:hypothetical protein
MSADRSLGEFLAHVVGQFLLPLLDALRSLLPGKSRRLFRSSIWDWSPSSRRVTNNLEIVLCWLR